MEEGATLNCRRLKLSRAGSEITLRKILEIHYDTLKVNYRDTTNFVR